MNILSLIKLLKPFAKNISKKQKPIVTNINKKTIPELDNSGRIAADDIFSINKRKKITLDPELRPSLQPTADEKALTNLLNGYAARTAKQPNPSLIKPKKPRGVTKGITLDRTQKQQALDKSNKANKNIIKEELDDKDAERYRKHIEKHYKKVDEAFRKEQKIIENIYKVVDAGIKPAIYTTVVGGTASAVGNKIQYDENKKLETENEKLRTERNSLKDELAASDWANRVETIKGLEDDLRRAEADNKTLKKQLSTSKQQKEIDNLKTQLQELDKKHREEIFKYDSRMSDQDGRHSAKIKRLTDTNKDLEAQVEKLRQIITDTQKRKNKATKETNALSGEVKQKAKGVLQQLQNTQPSKETTNNNTKKNITNALISLGVGSGAGFGTYGLARLLGARKPWAVGLGTTAGVIGSLVSHPDIRNAVAKYLKKNK